MMQFVALMTGSSSWGSAVPIMEPPMMSRAIRLRVAAAVVDQRAERRADARFKIGRPHVRRRP